MLGAEDNKLESTLTSKKSVLMTMRYDGEEVADANKSITFNNTSNSLEERRPNATFVLNKRLSLNRKKKDDYHDQRLSQSKFAFWLSFYGSIAGFIVIIGSIIAGLITGNEQWPGIVSGIVVESTSVLLYGLSNKANEKISEFFSELTKDGNIEQALNQVDLVKDTKIQDELRVKLSLHLVGIDEERICKNTKTVCKVNDTNDEM